jgi:NAD+-dependent farnesol dehydrogenase
MAAIFVTGATGYLGASLVRRLVAEEEVVVLARDADRAARQFPGVRVCRGDVLHVDSLRRGLAGCDRVFHCAAHVRVWDRDPGRFEAVNVEGLRNVLAAARDAGIRRIVYTSSFIALGPTDGQIGDEEWEPQGREFHNQYERTKAMGDRLARREASQGAPLVILYPGVIYGPGPATQGNLVGKMVSDFIAGRLPGVLGAGDRRFCYAFVSDVVAGHLLALRKAKEGARYVLGGENRTMREVFAELERLTSLPAPSRRIPYAVAELAGRLQRWRAALTGREPEITDEVVRIYRHEWAYTSRRAEAELGYFITPLARGLAETVAGFRGAREAAG